MDMIVSRDIAAEPAAVWAVITDLDATEQMLSGVQRIERLDDGSGFGVGTCWRETRTMFGREATERLQVTAIEPGSSYTVVAISGNTVYTSTLRVEPTGEGSARLTMTFAAQPSGATTRLLAATIGRLFQGATRKMLQRDLADIATAAETTRPR